MQQVCQNDIIMVCTTDLKKNSHKRIVSIHITDFIKVNWTNIIRVAKLTLCIRARKTDITRFHIRVHITDIKGVSKTNIRVHVTNIYDVRVHNTDVKSVSKTDVISVYKIDMTKVHTTNLETVNKTDIIRLLPLPHWINI